MLPILPSIRTEVEPVIHADNDFATVAFLRIKNAILESKEEQNFEDMPVPPLLEDDLFKVQDAIMRSSETDNSVLEELEASLILPVGDNVINSGSANKQINSWVAISNIHRNISQGLQLEISIEDEVKECFYALQGLPFYQYDD